MDPADLCCVASLRSNQTSEYEVTFRQNVQLGRLHILEPEGFLTSNLGYSYDLGFIGDRLAELVLIPIG